MAKLAKQSLLTSKGKKFVITGCGRSGTLYLSKVFNILGYKIGHEVMNQDGIVSWLILQNDQINDVKRLMQDKDVSYFCLMRDPLKVIKSICHCDALRNRRALQIFRETFPECKYLQGYVLGAKYWIEWNKRIFEEFPIEEIIHINQLNTEKGVQNLCNLINVSFTWKIYEKINKLGQNIHTLKQKEINASQKANVELKQELTYEYLVKQNKEIAEELKTYALQFGYDITKG